MHTAHMYHVPSWLLRTTGIRRHTFIIVIVPCHSHEQSRQSDDSIWWRLSGKLSQFITHGWPDELIVFFQVDHSMHYPANLLKNP